MTTIGKPTNNIMITSIDKIPLKTNGSVAATDDMVDDPIVKDVLSEFEKELALTEPQPPSQSSSNYQINYQQPPQDPYSQQFQPPQAPIKHQLSQNKSKQDFYIDNDLIVKVFIICIVIALITNPYIYTTILSKIPDNFSVIIENYNYFIKLIIIFVVLYLMMFYKVL
jgi:hypothetical protein